jgi:hypothetical protein
MEISQRPWVRVVTLPGTFTAEGFGRTEGNGVVVPWSSVLGVALGYEIHPTAIADWDFWAFQGPDPSVTYWVYEEGAFAFSEEVRRRFSIGEIPAMKEWADREYCIRARVVWPAADVGEPMYVTVKRHWWSWHGRLSYAKVPGHTAPLPGNKA